MKQKITPGEKVNGSGPNKPAAAPAAEIPVQQFRFMWRPQKDITIYELAVCVPFLSRPPSGYPMTEQALQTLGSASRHFERVQLTPQEQEQIRQRVIAAQQMQAQQIAAAKAARPVGPRGEVLDGGNAKG